jgi:OOP family OmpA-OmpF porin
VAAAVLALPAVAKAEPVTGFYAGLGAGFEVMQEEGSTLSAQGMTGHSQLQTGVGPIVVLNAGYGLSNGLRAEVEGNFGHNNFSVSQGSVTASGLEQKYGVMVNVLYELVGLVPLVQPYIGVGAGYQWVQESNFRINAPGMAFYCADSKGVFAYQAILGAAVPIAGVPGLSLTADYRFMALVGDRIYHGMISVGPWAMPARLTLAGDFNHAFIIGFRYAF